jgi:hypothetical protein
MSKESMDMPQEWWEANFDKLVTKAHNDINHYAAIFVFEKEEISSSGVFVNTCGYEGILTAHHVAEALLKNPSFGLVISQTEHSFNVRSTHCVHVPIGVIKPYSELGPDLSFIIIRDQNVLGTIKRFKSFCFLDNRDLDYFKQPFQRMLWCVSGSPYEAAKMLPSPASGGRLKQFNSFLGEIIFDSREERDSFDYLKFIVPNGTQGYPKNYQGVSGGGIWLVPFTFDDSERMETVRTEIPILAGIAFYQLEIDNDQKFLICHGFDSIYTRLRETLRNWK